MILNILVSIAVMTIAILFAVYNGYIINWKHKKANKNWLDKWHRMSLVIRLFVLVASCIPFWNDWWLMGLMGLIALNIIFTGYNIVINLVMGLQWYYVGATSVIDKYFREHQVLYWGLITGLFISPVVYFFFA